MVNAPESVYRSSADAWAEVMQPSVLPTCFAVASFVMSSDRAMAGSLRPSGIGAST
jgi:hypothetical protein